MLDVSAERIIAKAEINAVELEEENVSEYVRKQRETCSAVLANYLSSGMPVKNTFVHFDMYCAPPLKRSSSVT